MKIDHTNVSGLTGGLAGAGTGRTERGDHSGDEKQKAATASASASGAIDEIQLSELGKQLRVLASDSPERNQRIQELAKLVESGRYEVDAQDLSRRLIEDAQKERG
jgi:flagellar biosynthesis anti-sigma factor FlgM